MDKTISAQEPAFSGKIAFFEAWERQIPEMADLETAFPPSLKPRA